MSTSPLLKVEDLHVRIAGSHILQGVSFDVQPSRVTVLLGRNGVGKTTTIKAIMGLVPSQGTIDFVGESIIGTRPHKIARMGIGYVPEDRETFAGLTVGENLRLAERPGESADYDRVYSIFPELKQRTKQAAGSLSGGQQQMVALGRVLLRSLRIVLIDEPTKGLAPRLVQEVGEMLVRVAEETPVLLVEQNLPLVERMADDVVVIDSGRVAHRGQASTFFQDSEFTNELLGVSSRGAH